MSLNNNQKDQLENAALLAFRGSAAKLEHGFRLTGAIGQTAALYWSDVMPGNDVEIALCDSRLTEIYDLRTVRRWITREQQQSGRKCNIHKHGSDWPILGFTFAEALEFLARCRALRMGFLSAELLHELRKEPDSSAASQAEDLVVALAGLRPTARKSVIDLVKSAGVDVSRWYINKDGSRAANPRSNPAYCFNWSFGGDGEPVVACLWHDALKIEADQIVFDENLRLAAQRLLEIANASGEETDVRNRARTQARRATALDNALSSAWKNQTPVRVIVNEGFQRSADAIGKESSKVELRELDKNQWKMVDYDSSNGQLRLARASAVPRATLQLTQDMSVPALSSPRFVDQHTIMAAVVTQVESTRLVYSRSRAVRDIALERAAGSCELCGQKGFVTRAGTIFLETHHVVPLSEGGPDDETNVVALCANDHRQAHFSEDAEAIRTELRAILADIYPSPDTGSATSEI